MLKYVQIAGVLLATALFAVPSFAQRGGGCARQSSGARSGGAGGRTSNATARNGGGFMANAMLLNQMMAMNQAAQNRANNSRPPAAGTNQPRPTPEQFVQAAMRFDGDRDRQLDQTEITRVANAVVAELRQRKTVSTVSSNRLQQRPAPASTRTAAAVQSVPTQKQMVEAFAKRAMTFDTDNSGTLSNVETRRLAAAFIRTL